MKLRRVGPVQIAELIIGVIPSVIFVVPSLIVLITGLVWETIPGMLQGGSFRGQFLETLFVLLGPIGLVALISLCLVILLGPEEVMRRKPLRMLAIASGIPGLGAAVWVTVDSVFFLARRAFEGGTGLRILQIFPGTALTALSLAGSAIIGWRYLGRIGTSILRQRASRS